MKIRLFRIVCILILIASVLSACTGTSANSSQPLRVGWSMWPGMYPMIIAQEQGIFEKHGIAVESIVYDTYKETIPALGSGMLDGGSLALGDALLNDVAEDVKIVLISDESAGADQILAAPNIQSIQDLRGKRIGVQAGTYGELLVQQMLDKNGISRADVTLVEIPVEAIPEAIPSMVDAGHTFEPYASQARAKGDIALFTTADTPGLVLDVFGFRKETLEQRPEDVKAFIAAWFEAVAFWQTNPTEANAMIARFLGVDASEISLEGIKIYNQIDNLQAFEQNGTGSIYYPASIENQFLLDRGIISYPIQIDTSFLDPSFLQ